MLCTPGVSFLGTDKLVYMVADAGGDTVVGTVWLQIQSDGGPSQNLVAITVTASPVEVA